MSHFFICAYCRELITDDFVVGLKPVAPGKFGFYFHRNRPQCFKTSGINPE